MESLGEFLEYKNRKYLIIIALLVIEVIISMYMVYEEYEKRQKSYEFILILTTDQLKKDIDENTKMNYEYVRNLTCLNWDFINRLPDNTYYDYLASYCWNVEPSIINSEDQQ